MHQAKALQGEFPKNYIVFLKALQWLARFGSTKELSGIVIPAKAGIQVVGSP